MSPGLSRRKALPIPSTGTENRLCNPNLSFWDKCDFFVIFENGRVIETGLKEGQNLQPEHGHSLPFSKALRRLLGFSSPFDGQSPSSLPAKDCFQLLGFSSPLKVKPPPISYAAGHPAPYCVAGLHPASLLKSASKCRPSVFRRQGGDGRCPCPLGALPKLARPGHGVARPSQNLRYFFLSRCTINIQAL